MKRLLLFLTCMLMLFGVSKAENKTISFSGFGSSGNGVVATERTEGIFKITFEKNGPNNAPTYYADDLRMYASNGNGNAITISCSEDYKMTGMVFTSSGTGYNFSNTSANVGSLSISGTTNTWSAGSNTVTSVTFKNTNDGNTQVRLKEVVITYEAVDPSNPPTKVKYDAPFNGKTYTITVGETLNIERGNSYPSTMVFILGENSILKEDDENFTLTGVSAGTETVDVMWDEDDDFEEGEASFTVTVNEPITGTTATAAFYASASYTGNAKYTTQIPTGNIAGSESTATTFSAGDINLWIEKINNSTSNVTNNFVRWYQNDVLHIVPLNGATITQVIIAEGDGKTGTPSVEVGTGSFSGSTYTWTGNTNKELTLTATDQIRFNVLTVTYIEAETGGLKNANLSFPETEYSVRMGEGFTAPTLSNPFDVTPVTYSSSEESVATVVAGTGEVTLVGAGTTTITATFAGNDTYDEGSASYILTVKPAMSSDVIVDEITAATAFVPSFGGYGDYTYTSTETEITYTLHAMKGGSNAAPNIQINNSSSSGNGGMVVTANPQGYEVVSVAIEQTSGAQINVYANTDEYTGVGQLYSNPIVGNFIGSISSTSGELDNFTDDAYIGWGLRTSGGARNITKITVTYAIPEGVAKKPSLSFTFNGEIVSDPVELDWNATEFPTLVLPEGITSATYTSSDTSVAEINSSTGEITLKGVKGETTITATTEAVDGQWKAGSVSYTLVVLDPNSKTATFDFTTKDPYGMTTTSTNTTYFYDDISFSENGVTMDVTGKYRSWGSSSYDFRIYTDDNSAIKISAPAGYMLETIEFTGSSLNYLKPTTGTYSNGMWESNAGEVDTSVVFTPTGTPNIETITVWYTLAPPQYYLYSDMIGENNPSYKFVYYEGDDTSDDTSLDGAYILDVSMIKAKEEFFIKCTDGTTYTYYNDIDKDIEFGQELHLNTTETAGMTFPFTYIDVQFTWWPATQTLIITGTKDNTIENIVVTVGNDKTMQSGSVSTSEDEGIKGHIELQTVGDGALVYVFAPNDVQVYYAIELSNTADQKSVKAKVGEDLTYKAATESKYEAGAYNIALATGTSGTLYLKYGASEEDASEPVAYSFSVLKTTPTGVEVIGAEEAEAEYYTLQGVKVQNPEKGIYIKVVGNKAVKVVK